MMHDHTISFHAYLAIGEDSLAHATYSRVVNTLEFRGRGESIEEIIVSLLNVTLSRAMWNVLV